MELLLTIVGWAFYIVVGIILYIAFNVHLLKTLDPETTPFYDNDYDFYRFVGLAALIFWPITAPIYILHQSAHQISVYILKLFEGEKK